MNDENPWDRRIENQGELARRIDMLRAASVLAEDRLTSYAVNIDGTIATCLGWKRGPNDWVPVAIVFDSWDSIPQESRKFGAVKKMRKPCPMCRDEGVVSFMDLQYTDEDVGDGWMCPRCRYEE